MSNLKQDIDHLRHMLGVGTHIKMRSWGYRNHFASSKRDEPSMERLVADGLAKRGGAYHDSYFYHATTAGMELAGLSKAAIKRQFQKANP